MLAPCLQALNELAQPRRIAGLTEEYGGAVQINCDGIAKPVFVLRRRFARFKLNTALWVDEDGSVGTEVIQNNSLIVVQVLSQLRS